MGLAAFHDLLRRQHGVIATWQLEMAGIASSTLHDRVRREGWRSRHRGTFVAPWAPRGHHQRIAEVVVACGPDALAGARTAAFLHGLLAAPPPRLEVVVPRCRRPRRTGIQLMRTSTLRAWDRTMVAGIATTAVPRTIVDTAGTGLPTADLRGMLIDGRQQRIVDLAEVLTRTADLPLAKGRRRLIRLLTELDPQTCDSVFVDRVLTRLRRDGFSPDVTAVAVDTPDRTLHPDVTFARQRVAIECDGLAFHRDRRALDLDQRKHNAYQLAGWVVLRIGWDRLERDWDGFRSELEAALSRGT